MMNAKWIRWTLLSLTAISGCTKTTPTTGSALMGTPPGRDPNEPRADAPLTASTRFAAGQLAESQGDMNQAITQYEAALKADPKFAQPMLRLGVLYTSLKKFDPAVDMWHRYIKVTGDSAAGYCNLGLTFELDGRLKESEGAYTAAIKRDPKNEPARMNYGLMLIRQGRMNDAIAQLQTVLTPAESHYNIASVLESEGKTDAAKSEYRESLRLDPDMNDAKSRLASLDSN